MNIFVLSTCPLEAAVMHCDKHVPKMIVETAQMLCTAASVLNPSLEVPYKPCFKNHPCTIWVRESRFNYLWLCALGAALCVEYTKRFGKTHKTADVILQMTFAAVELEFSKEELTPFALCMPEQYRNAENPVLSYRSFYNNEKLFAKWERGTPKPEWSTVCLEER